MGGGGLALAARQRNVIGARAANIAIIFTLSFRSPKEPHDAAHGPNPSTLLRPRLPLFPPLHYRQERRRGERVSTQRKEVTRHDHETFNEVITGRRPHCLALTLVLFALHVNDDVLSPGGGSLDEVLAGGEEPA